MAKKLLIVLFSFLTLILFTACGSYKAKGIQIAYYIPQGHLAPSEFTEVPKDGIKLNKPVAKKVNAKGEVIQAGYELFAPAKIIAWYLDPAHTEEVNFDTHRFKESAALFAKIEFTEIKINFAQLETGTVIEGDIPTKYDFTKGTNLPSAKRTGYDFKGWSTTDPSLPDFDPVNSVVLSLKEKTYFEDITLWPYFLPVEYQITIIADGKRYEVDVLFGQQIQKLVELTKVLTDKYGTKFKGWYFASGTEFKEELKYDENGNFNGVFYSLNGNLVQSTRRDGTIKARIGK